MSSIMCKRRRRIFVALLAAMAFTVAGCDDSEPLAGDYEIRVIDTYTLIALADDDRDVTVAPQIGSYAVVGDIMLGSRREITMPRQVLSEEVEYFILDAATGGLEAFVEKSAFEEAAQSRGIEIESAQFHETRPSIGE